MRESPIWENSFSGIREYPELRGRVRTQVLIIGGGMAGVLTAKILSDRGVKCTIAEMNRLCSGVTCGTTAKITAGHGLIYSRIAEKYGTESAKMYLDANTAALKKYAEIAKKIHCDFERRDSYIYTRSNPDAIENELKVLEKIGAETEYADITKLPFPTKGAVRYKNQAQFNPMKFVAGIIPELSDNVTIFEHTHIVDIDGRTAYSAGGRITADALIVTTHFPFVNRHGLYFLKLYQSRSHAAALENAPLCGGMYMDENPTGWSFRDYGKQLIVGGGSHRTGEPCRRDELREFIRSNYPKAKTTAMWSTQDCISLDGIPYIGKYSRTTPHLYAATGFNKWGMTSSMTAAMILADMVTGTQNDTSALFSPSRNIFCRKLVENALTAAKNIFTTETPRCPHMGCALKKNPAEHTWECPCHGSVFDEKGRLKYNPANRDL